MHLPVSGTAKVDAWTGYEWVIWQIEVIDPEYRISEPYVSENVPFLLDEYSREAVADLAVHWGCVYEGSWEGAWGSDNDPCYRWWFRVPQARHSQRGPRGWPVAVEECQQALDRFFCDHHQWWGIVDRRRTEALRAGQHV